MANITRQRVTVRIEGLTFADVEQAKAAAHVIITCEEGVVWGSGWINGVAYSMTRDRSTDTVSSAASCGMRAASLLPPPFEGRCRRGGQAVCR